MNAHQQPIEAASSRLANVDVQRLLDFLDHLPERFTPVVEIGVPRPIAYYMASDLVDDDLRSKVLVFDPEFTEALRRLARAFT